MALFFGGHKKAKEKKIEEIKLSQIKPNQFQPRKYFTDESIAELAQTLSEHGLLQPIVVRVAGKDQYEIIAGERRFRAATSLNWEKIPAIIEEMDDQKTASLALIENLQRENLNPIDEAKAYLELMDLNKLKQTELASEVGKSQSYIANKVRLLKLGEQAQEALLQGTITQRHGRELLKLEGAEQDKVLQTVLANKLNVKETERLVERANRVSTPRTKKPKVNARGVSRPQKDFRVPINTIKKTIEMIEGSGTRVDFDEQFVDGDYQITIDLLKD